MKSLTGRLSRKLRQRGDSGSGVSSVATNSSVFSDSTTRSSPSRGNNLHDCTGVNETGSERSAHSNGETKSTDDSEMPRRRPAAISSQFKRNSGSHLVGLSQKEAKSRLKSRLKNFKGQKSKIYKYHQSICEQLDEYENKTLPQTKNDAVYRLKQLFTYGLGKFRHLFERRGLLSLKVCMAKLKMFSEKSDLLLRHRIETEEEIMSIESALEQGSMDSMMECLMRQTPLVDPGKLLATSSKIEKQEKKVEILESELQEVHDSIAGLVPELRLHSPKDRKKHILTVLASFSELRSERKTFFDEFEPKRSDSSSTRQKKEEGGNVVLGRAVIIGGLETRVFRTSGTRTTERGGSL
eukprot:gb/GECG01015627.1/.p1 GENE.gb/GECG01015627.1/~~gb/GECG01015627.1/.p1  ORF type:complete len:353 (+),score=54.83 gb/GECG01015627.1/:1-1059(+)